MLSPSPLPSIMGYLPQFFAKMKCTRRLGDRTHECNMKETNRAIKWQRAHAVYKILAVLEFAFNQKHSIYYHIGSLGYMYGCEHSIASQFKLQLFVSISTQTQRTTIIFTAAAATATDNSNNSNGNAFIVVVLNRKSYT